MDGRRLPGRRMCASPRRRGRGRPGSAIGDRGGPCLCTAMPPGHHQRTAAERATGLGAIADVPVPVRPPAHAGTIVFVHVVSSVQIRRQAQSVIGVTRDGATVARVLVRSSAHTVELIAHEFEHVLEYLEGVDHRRSGTMLSHDAYETDRAMDAGTRVAREVRGWRTQR